MLYREPKLLKFVVVDAHQVARAVSVLYREPKLLKLNVCLPPSHATEHVSVLYREPKLLKFAVSIRSGGMPASFSALP